MELIRKPAVAGIFYPKNKEDLEEMIGEFLRQVNIPDDLLGKDIKAVIVPHAGYLYSGLTAAHAYKILSHKIKTKHFVLLGPSHFFAFQGAAQDDSTHWDTPLGKIKIKKLRTEPQLVTDSEAHRQEHSLEVQLPFLQKIFKEFMISPIVTGVDYDFQMMANLLNKLLDENTLLIISSDLSHFYPLHTAKTIDQSTIDTILKLDDLKLQKDTYEACGKDGILTVVKIAKLLSWKPRMLHYDTSATESKDKNRVVGYTSIAFTV